MYQLIIIYQWTLTLSNLVLLCAISAVTANSRDALTQSVKPPIADESKLANIVCAMLDRNVTVEDCQKNFLDADPEKKLFIKPPQFVVKCQSMGSLMVQVAARRDDVTQIVVLVPYNDSDRFISGKIKKNRLSTRMTLFPAVSSYTSWTSVVSREGRRSAWVRGVDVLPVADDSQQSHKKYEIQTQIPYGISKINEKVNGWFTWNNYDDADNCFEVRNRCKKLSANYLKKTTRTIGPEHDRSLVVEGLGLGESCKFMLEGEHGTTELKYRVPSVLRWNDTYNVTLPSKPDNLSLSIVPAASGAAGWDVSVSWSQPLVAPERYLVSLLLLDTNTEWNLTAPGNAMKVTFEDVTAEGPCYVIVTADSRDMMYLNSFLYILPGLSEVDLWRNDGVDVDEGGVSTAVERVAGGAVGAALTALALLSLAWIGLKRRMRAKKSRVDYSLNPDGKDLAEVPIMYGPEASSVDRWEIAPERVTVHEVIGEGAFGVVKRGVLAPAGKEVAVKMLKDFPSVEEVRSFRSEMELMKSVGAHQHVVSLLGCCSGRRLLIVAEYCSRGDLLTYLRCSWDVMVSKRNAKYYDNNINASEYRNDLFKSKDSASKLVINKLYELNGVCDADLTVVDLLSFCRQIAMGMEFLASNRVVHRDLAARNILVSADKTLKIADFGLSRDVYQDNQYKQKGNGKMPVKWMAIESLTHRVYTTQSDVWSFGVVMWEVVTVGGAPYPGIAAARLPRLLRAGYRMPPPPNCSKQLYEVMVSCWAARACSRPTFGALVARLDALLHAAAAHHYLPLHTDDAPLPPLPPPPPPRYSAYTHIINSLRLDRGRRSRWPRTRSAERPLPTLTNHYTSPPDVLARPP